MSDDRYTEWGGRKEIPCRRTKGCAGGLSHDESCGTIATIIGLRAENDLLRSIGEVLPCVAPLGPLPRPFFDSKLLFEMLEASTRERDYEAPADPLAHIRNHFK